MKKTNSPTDFLIFKSKYERASGLKLPMEFLEKSNVYIFKKDNQIVGGFILGTNNPLRTLKIFVSAAEGKSVRQHFTHDKYCEVCCLWVERKYRKKKLFNAKVWLQMALTVSRQSKEYIMYGTNTKGLAKMYGYPKNSILIHKDKVANRATYIFLAKRHNFLLGALELVFSKLFKNARNRNFETNEELKNAMLYELSI